MIHFVAAVFFAACTGLAYNLWVKAGRPEGDGKNFWYEAERMKQEDR